MWRVANVYGARTALVVTQEYHLYRAVYDAKGVGMDVQGVISDRGEYENQGYYSMRECAGRIKDFAMVTFDAAPGNSLEGMGL
jgi:vancomycin permeability regulator SanA